MKHNFNQLSIDEIIVNDVDQEESVFALLKEIDGFLITSFVTFLVNFNFVNGCPDVDESVQSFIFPKFESLVIDNGWLDDFSTFKDAPCHSIDIVCLNVLKGFVFQIECLKRYVRILIKMFNQSPYDIWMNKHFKICLLINISILWTPSVFWVAGFSRIYTWLRIDCEQFVGIQR